MEIETNLPILAVWDGSFYVSRALHVVPDKRVADFPVAAAIQALKMFSNDYKALNPKYCCFVFDAPGATFRHRLCASYKRNRVATQEEVDKQYQIRLTAHLLRLAGYPVIHMSGVEADDVIGSLSRQASELVGEEVHSVIFTGDKDLQQLVRKNVTTIDTRQKPVWYGTPNTVVERYKVPAKRIADYLALMGDSNDGVKGISGVGPVRARKLLEKFGSVKDILELESKELAKEKLSSEDIADLRLAYKLVKVKTKINLSSYLPLTAKRCNVEALERAVMEAEISNLPYLISHALDTAKLSGKSLFDDDMEIAELEDDFSDVPDSLFNLIRQETLETIDMED